MKAILTFTAILFSTFSGRAAAIYESFDNGIDPLVWAINQPFSDSYATAANGILSFGNRGGLVTQSDFTGPIIIDGTVSFTGNQHDMFTFVTRTTGTYSYPYGTFDNGIRFNWLKMSDTGQILNIVSIAKIVGGNPGNDIDLAFGNFDFANNHPYSFRIVDDGLNIALYFDDLTTPLLTATESSHPGNRIGFYDREGAGAGSLISAGTQVQMDFISIVPEPSSVSILSIAAGALLYWKRTSSSNISRRSREP